MLNNANAKLSKFQAMLSNAKHMLDNTQNMLNTFFAHIYNMLTMVNAYVELHCLSE